MADDGGSVDLRTSDARQPRIESDAQRVQLMTVHNAKGLEFPIVFLPLAWRSFGMPNPRVLKFHDDQKRECADAGSIAFDEHRMRHFREDLEERQRLQYVALTRAVHALHVYWVGRPSAGGGDDAVRQTVPLDLLLYAAQEAQGVAPGAETLHALDALPGVDVIGPCTGSPQLYRGAEELESSRAARAPLPQLRPFRWLHSFSSLTRKIEAIEFETLAADEIEASQPAPESAPDDQPEDARLLALQYQRGPRFGDAVHKILESAAPGALWPAQRELLVQTLQANAVRAGNAEDSGALEAVGRMIDRVRDADLGDGMRLDQLDAAARVMEFEFQFPLQRVGVERLRSICAEHGHADVVPAVLAFDTLDGMLTGFVDLVFSHGGRYHVLDYKTNWLGARLVDYDGAALADAMHAHHYELQALLYTVAVHRYLGGRLDGYTPERHLGDSWYLFLRALGLAPGLGVWRRRWPVALIVALDDAFAGVVAAA
jgi:exodeoxyribonuclease V beta subunit